jgi:hypothetical protein
MLFNNFSIHVFSHHFFEIGPTGNFVHVDIVYTFTSYQTRVSHFTYPMAKMSQKQLSQIKPYNYIPDISFQLIFCFLNLKELTRIIQCYKEWKRIATTPLFLNMFRHEEHDVLKIKNIFKTRRASIHPFKHIIQHISIEYDVILKSPIMYLKHFHRLVSLELKIQFCTPNESNLEFFIMHVFQALAPTLMKLKLYIYEYTYSFHQLFLNHLPLLKSLTCLTLMNGKMSDIRNISFLAHMKQLQSFTLANFCVVKNNFIQSISSLSKLSHLSLGLNYTGHSGVSIHDLNQTFSVLQQSNLKHLDQFFNITKNQEYEFEQLLNKFIHLETIGVTLSNWNDTHYSLHRIPVSLGKWIRILEIYHRCLNEQDVCDIICLSNLKSLILSNCGGNLNMQKQLIRGLSSRLEVFELYGNGISQISFQDLATCKKLTTLTLSQIKSVEFGFIDRCDYTEFIQKINLLNNNNCEVLSRLNFFYLCFAIVLFNIYAYIINKK